MARFGILRKGLGLALAAMMAFAPVAHAAGASAPPLTAKTIAAAGGATNNAAPRLISTRNIIARQGLSDGVVTSGTYRVKINIPAGATDIQCVWPNWYMNNLTETVGPNDITIRAALESSGGTFYPLFFKGTRDITIQGGAEARNDVARAYLPAGTAYVRTYVSVASAGMKWPLAATTQPGDGEGNNAAAPGSDLTTSGTVPTAFSYAFIPIACHGITASTKKTIVEVGDSIFAGQGDSQDVGFVNRAIADRYAWVNLAKAGDTINSVVNTAGNYRRFGVAAEGTSTALINLGINDIKNARTLSQIQTDYLELWKRLSNSGVREIIQLTPLFDVSSTTNNYTTAAGQTSTTATLRNQVATWLTSNPSPLVRVVDIAKAIAPSGDTSIGKWGVLNDGYALTGAINAATSATLNKAWTYETNAGGYTVVFSDGTAKAVTLTKNSTAISWTGAVTASAVIIFPFTGDGVHPNLLCHQVLGIALAPWLN